MAVTQIRKVSSYTLLCSMLISVAIIALFFFGGSEVITKNNQELKNYTFTEPLLYWSYILFGLTILATIVFAFKGFFARLVTDPKGALGAVSGVIAFFALLVITYLLGDATPLEGLNADAQKFNTEGWLKATDMWLYSSYILLGLCVLSAVFGAIKSMLKK